MNPRDDMPVYSESEMLRVRAELAELDQRSEAHNKRAHEALMEVARLRAELADQAETLRVTDDCLFRAVEDAQRAEAAITRVRELCVTLNRDYPRNECAHLFLRALDGAE